MKSFKKVILFFTLFFTLFTFFDVNAENAEPPKLDLWWKTKKCPAPYLPWECEKDPNYSEDDFIGPKQPVKEIIVANDKDSVNTNRETRAFVPTFYPRYSGSNSKIIYSYVNKDSHLIYFKNNGEYCNVSIDECYRANFKSDTNNKYLSDTYYNVINSKDYIVFLFKKFGSNYYDNFLGVYNKKTNKFLNISLNPYYVNHNLWWMHYFSEDFSIKSFNVENNTIYFYNAKNISYGSDNLYEYLFTYSIDFDNLSDSDFKSNKIYYLYFDINHKIISNDDKNLSFSYFLHNNYDLIWSNNIKIASSDIFYPYNIDINKLTKTDWIHWFNVSLSVFKNQQKNLVVNFINNKLRFRYDSLSYFFKNALFYVDDSYRLTSSFRTSEWIKTKYINDSSFQFFPPSFKFLNFVYSKDLKKYIFSYYTEMKFLWYEKYFYSAVTSNLTDFNDGELYKNLYYLWTANWINILWNQTISKFKQFNLDSSYSTINIAKYWWDLHLFYYSIGNNSWLYYISKNPILEKPKSIIWGDLFNDWLNIDNTNPDWDAWGEKNPDWSYKDVDKERKRLQDIYDKQESLKNWAKKILWEKSYFFKILDLFIFNFPDNYAERIKIPYLKPIVKDNHLKISYDESEIVPTPVKDRLKISDLEPNWAWKIFISFFLWVFYICIRLVFLSLNLLWAYFLYDSLIKLFKVVLGRDLKDSNGNLFTSVIFVIFIWFFFSIVSWILALFATTVLPILNLSLDMINLFFWFINESFFDFNIFKLVVNSFAVAIPSLFIAYVWYKFSLYFWRIF